MKTTAVTVAPTSRMASPMTPPMNSTIRPNTAPIAAKIPAPSFTTRIVPRTRTTTPPAMARRMPKIEKRVGAIVVDSRCGRHGGRVRGHRVG